MVISAFPAMGKSHAYKILKNIRGMNVLDSDSSQFSWIYDVESLATKERNPDFPNNYIQHIKENMNTAECIFVSSHENVRQAMKEAGIPYILVYPKKDMLPEIVGRCVLRGSDDNFIKTLIENWDNWIESCENDTGATKKMILDHNEYLHDCVYSMHLINM